VGVSAGPKVVSEGLVFSFDARNSKTYDDIPGITDHGISDWYCFVDGTATYSAIYPNTEIIEIDSDGNEVGIVTTGTDPQRGTFTTTADRRYYGTKAIHLLQTTASDDQHELAPVSFAGTYFAHRWIRNSPTTYYAYAPQDDTTLEFFDNNATGGVTGIATATHNISRGLTTSFTSTAVNTWQFFKADKPIIMTAGGTGWDKTILAPATQYNYKRRNANSVTINNTAPSGISTYVTYDTSLPVATVEIADGSGGDCTQGIGYEYLSDTYSWGDVLSDFALVSPYANNVVNVSYWLNNQWNLGGSYSLDGTQTEPAEVYRNGPGGFDSAATGTAPYSGNYSNFNASTLWKFEGTQPFALIINDTADDEERLLGWMSNNHLRTSSNVTQSFVNLIDKDDRSRMKIYGKDLTTTVEYAGAKLSAADYIEFDGSNDYTIGSAVLPSGQQKYTISAWWKTPVNNRTQSVWEQNTSTQQANTRAALLLIGAYWGLNGQSNDAHDKVPVRINQWTNGVITVDTTLGTNPIKIYENGFLYWQGDTSGGASNLNVGTSGGAGLGRKISTNSEYFIGTIAQTQIYDRVLTAQEIQQNFNATRSRFGI